MKIISLLLLVVVVVATNVDGACQSCLMELTTSSLFGRPHSHNKESASPSQTSGTFHTSTLPLGLSSGLSAKLRLGSSAVSSSHGSFASPALHFLAVRKLMSVAYYHNRMRNADSVTTPIASSIHTNSRWSGGLFLSENSSSDNPLLEKLNEDEAIMPKEEDTTSVIDGEEVMSASMIMAIGFYKNWISPLLPPACRFLPTCSQYGAQAIKEFGPQKGLILTAWRLARCSPFGGKGYDPPKWPPVAYNYGSY